MLSWPYIFTQAFRRSFLASYVAHDVSPLPAFPFLVVDLEAHSINGVLSGIPMGVIEGANNSLASAI